MTEGTDSLVSGLRVQVEQGWVGAVPVLTSQVGPALFSETVRVPLQTTAHPRAMRSTWPSSLQDSLHQEEEKQVLSPVLGWTVVPSTHAHILTFSPFGERVFADLRTSIQSTYRCPWEASILDYLVGPYVRQPLSS